MITLWILFKSNQFYLTWNLSLDQMQDPGEHLVMIEYKTFLDLFGKGEIPYNNEGYISLPKELVIFGFEPTNSKKVCTKF